jgi:hypothetical protein
MGPLTLLRSPVEFDMPRLVEPHRVPAMSERRDTAPLASAVFEGHGLN